MAPHQRSPYDSSPGHFYQDQAAQYTDHSVYDGAHGRRRGSCHSHSRLSDYDTYPNPSQMHTDSRRPHPYGDDYMYSDLHHQTTYETSQQQFPPAYGHGSPASVPVLLSSSETVDWSGFRASGLPVSDFDEGGTYSTQIRSAPGQDSISTIGSPYAGSWVQPLPALSESDLPFSFDGHGLRSLPYQLTRSLSLSSSENDMKECAHCHATSTPLWRREPGTLRLLCNACGLYLLSRNKHRPPELIAADKQDETEPDPFYTGPECTHCKSRTTSVWRRSKEGNQLCNACGVYFRMHGKDRPLHLRKNNVRPRSRS